MSDYEMKSAETINEMRVALEQYAYRGLYGGVVREVLEAARHRGLSGEDTYAMLAYHLLRQNTELHTRVLHGLATQTRKHILQLTPNPTE